MSVFLSRYHVATSYSKFLDRGKCHILVLVEQYSPLLHAAVVTRFVFADGLLHLFSVGCDVIPGGVQVRGVNEGYVDKIWASGIPGWRQLSRTQTGMRVP